MQTDVYEPPPRRPTLADVLTAGIPVERIILIPTPGTATSADVEQIFDHEDRLCELVDGVLVERAYGLGAAILNVDLACALVGFVQGNRLGFVVGSKAVVQLRPGLIRAPDIAYYSRTQFADGRLPEEPIPSVAPKLVVETWKPGNTPAEMNRKLRDYFAAGTRLVWYVQPEQRTVDVYDGLDRGDRLDDSGVLDGKAVLPGFQLKVGDLFDRGQYGSWMGPD